MTRHAPPPTRFAPASPSQRKAAAPATVAPRHAPPPTAYGHRFPMQAKPGTMPPTRFGASASRPAPIQRMEDRWEPYRAKPYGEGFLAAYDGGSVLTGYEDSAVDLLYQKFFGASTVNAFNSTLAKETYADLVEANDYAGLIAAFRAGNVGLKYDPEGFHCQMISGSFASFLQKIGMKPTPIATHGSRVIVRCPAPIDTTWTGGQVVTMGGIAVGGVRGFSEHHAVRIGTTIIDPTCGYVGDEGSWYAALIDYTAPVNKLKALFGVKPITNHATYKFYSVSANTVPELDGFAGAAAFSGTRGAVTIVMPSLSEANVTQVKSTLMV